MSKKIKQYILNENLLLYFSILIININEDNQFNLHAYVISKLMYKTYISLYCWQQMNVRLLIYISNYVSITNLHIVTCYLLTKIIVYVYFSLILYSKHTDGRFSGEYFQMKNVF